LTGGKLSFLETDDLQDIPEDDDVIVIE